MKRMIKILCLLLLPIIACSQVQNFQKINVDTVQSRTGSAFLFFNDSILIANGLIKKLSPTSSIRLGTAVMTNTTAQKWIGIGDTVFNSVTNGGLFRRGIGIGSNIGSNVKQGQILIGFDSGDSLNALDAGNSAIDNISIGWYNLRRIKRHADNVMIGYKNMENTDSGSYNVGIGEWALSNFVGGNSNVAIGEKAGSGHYHGSRNIFIGDMQFSNDFSQTNLDNSIFIGADAGQTGDNLNNVVIVGADANSSKPGTSSLGAQTSVTHDTSTAIGFKSTSDKKHHIELGVAADTVHLFNFKMTAGAGASKILVSDAQGVGTWQVPASVSRSGIVDTVYGGNGLTATQTGDSVVTLSVNTKALGGVLITGDSLEVDSTKYLPVHRLSDSTSTLRTDLKRKDDSTASSGYLPVHRLADSTSVLRTRIETKNRLQTWKEADGSPSVTDVDTVEVDSSQGIILTNPSNQRARLSLAQNLTSSGSPVFSNLLIRNMGSIYTTEDYFSVGFLGGGFLMDNIKGGINLAKADIGGTALKNKLLYGDNDSMFTGFAFAAKGTLLYSQGTTTVPIWEDYPFLYSSTSNLGFGLTDTSINKNISSVAQSGDTSSVRFDFTNLGKPHFQLNSIAGNNIAGIDTLGIVYATDAYVAPLFPTLTKGLFYLNGTDCVVEFSGNKSTLTNQGIADLIFTNQGVTSGTTRIATIQATTAASNNTGRLVFAVKKVGSDANPTTVASIDSNGSLTFTAAARGSDAYTTTATTDTVIVASGATTDYYFIQLTGTTAPVAADQSTVEALTGKFVVHRSASGTSGLTYNWFRIK